VVRWLDTHRIVSVNIVKTGSYHFCVFTHQT